MAETSKLAPAAPGAIPMGEDAPLFEILQTTRAMRRLRPDPVPRATLERLVEAASWAPSGGNSQDFSFLIADDRQQIAALAPAWQRIAGWYLATQTPPAHMSEAKLERMMAAAREQAERFAETPALIVACFTSRPTARRMARNWRRTARATLRLGPRGIRLIANYRRFLARGEAACVYPAVENLLLAARALGLGAVLTMWHVFFEQEFKRSLGIPRHVRTFAIVPVGYPQGRFGPVVRRPPSELIHWNRWQERSGQ
jgi:nitroreductase